MFTASLFTEVKRWEQPKCPPVEKGINKISTNGALSSHKKIPAITCMNLENIIPGERSQMQKAMCLMIPFI